MTKLLVLLTNHATLGTTDEANGTYAPELTHALAEFIKAGWDVDYASINGGAVPLYGTDADEITVEILARDDVASALAATRTVAEVTAADYDAVFYPGGFGLLSDLAENPAAAAVTAGVWDKGGVVGAVCHGPAGLLPITLTNGEKLISDKQVTGFTREEEVDYNTIDKIPFLLEESLSRTAAKYAKVQPWGEHVVVDGRLVTGQNPASAHAVGAEMIRIAA